MWDGVPGRPSRSRIRKTHCDRTPLITTTRRVDTVASELLKYKCSQILLSLSLKVQSEVEEKSSRISHTFRNVLRTLRTEPEIGFISKKSNYFWEITTKIWEDELRMCLQISQKHSFIQWSLSVPNQKTMNKCLLFKQCHKVRRSDCCIFEYVFRWIVYRSNVYLEHCEPSYLPHFWNHNQRL